MGRSGRWSRHSWSAGMERRHWRKKGAADVKGISEQYRYIRRAVAGIPHGEPGKAGGHEVWRRGYKWDRGSHKPAGGVKDASGGDDAAGRTGHTGTGVFRPAYGLHDRKGKKYIPGGTGDRESAQCDGDRKPVLQPR